MYNPDHFRESDTEELISFIRSHPFGTLISPVAAGMPHITHIPFGVHQMAEGAYCLRAHLARANPHCAALEHGARALAIFMGPHAYVSPAWYTVAPAVPTWNFSAVHVQGPVRLLSAEESLITLRALTAENEAHVGGSWSLDEQNPEYLARMVQGIVGFELQIELLEGKFKMSQNRSEADRVSICEALESRPISDSNSHETAGWVRHIDAHRRSGSR